MKKNYYRNSLKLSMAIFCCVALPSFLLSSLSYGQTPTDIRAAFRGNASGSSTTRVRPSQETADADRALSATSDQPTVAPSRPNSYKARNYELDLNEVEIGDLPDGWRAASDNIAVSMFGDSPAIKLARKGITEVDLDGLFEQSGSFIFSFTAGVSELYQQHELQVILVDEKGLELTTSISFRGQNARSKFDDAKEFETQNSSKEKRTFVIIRKDAQKGNFNFKEEGFDSEIVAVRKPEFGTLVSARIIMSDPEIAISNLRVAAQKSSSVLARQDTKQRYVLELEEADFGDWPDEWSGSNGMLISNLGNMKVLRPNSDERTFQEAKYAKLAIKGNFTLSYTIVTNDLYQQHEVNVIITDNQGKQITLPVQLRGQYVTYGLQQKTNQGNSAPHMVASFNLARSGNSFTLVMTGEYTNKATLNTAFGELKSITFQANSSNVGLSALKVIKLID